MTKHFTLCDGVDRYIESLPTYEPWKDKVFEINKVGNFLLPVEPVRIQWYYLNQVARFVSSYRNHFAITQKTFSDLPGVKSFDCPIVDFEWEHLDTSYIRMADVASRKVDGVEVDLLEGFSFEKTLSGAVSALFFAHGFDRYTSYWHALYGCDHGFILHESDTDSKRDEHEQSFKPLKFGLSYSELVSIPWGVRLEVKSSDEMVVRCLGDSMTSGLWDLSVNLKQGRVAKVDALLLYKNRRMCY